MLEPNETKENPEICSLVEYAYDLHSQGMNMYDTYRVPSMEFYNQNVCKIKQTEGGGVFGKRVYASHSESTVRTILGMCAGTSKRNGFKLDYAVMLQANNKSKEVGFSPLKIKDDSQKSCPTLDYDHSRLSEEEKRELFCKTMVFIGFKLEDVLAVLNGTMTAKEAYMHVAPDDLKYRSWVSVRRRYYVFDGNIAIEGNYGSMDLDTFPFPFDGQPILDCSKVKTLGVRFGVNKRKVKLINVNENKDSIEYTDLKNAIIDEPIDLSRVNASRTTFGHHTVINADHSIASLKDIDLSLAVNENGERYVTDQDGRLIRGGQIMTKDNKQSASIAVYSSADDFSGAIDSVNYKADGIGLVRTESIYDNYKDINGMIDYLTEYLEDDEVRGVLDRLTKLQQEQVSSIYLHYNGPVVFRLLDFKLKEFLTLVGRTTYEDADLSYRRGSYYLSAFDKLLIAQVRAICEEVSKKTNEVNFLIPYVRDTYAFVELKKKIIEVASEYPLSSISVGAMIENVEMACDADDLAQEADFISIGTNDLTESVTGITRDPHLPEYMVLTDEVKQLITEAIYRARCTCPDIWIGICGDHTNYLENMEFLSALDIDYITCNPEFIETNKEYLTQNSRQGNLGRKRFKKNSKKSF